MACLVDFDDASSGELAVSSEAVNAGRKFLAGHVGWILTEKLCKNGVEVAEIFWGVQAVLRNKFWALRAQILPITGLWEYSTKCRSNRDRQRIWH